jgi:hypothetical protein
MFSEPPGSGGCDSLHDFLILGNANFTFYAKFLILAGETGGK